MSRRKTIGSSVGKTLRTARQERGVLISDAATALHIPLRQLEALENDTAATAFAAPVYAFGALRAYAAWLGLPAQSLERTLLSQLSAAHATRSELKVHTISRWYERMLTARTVIAAVGTLLALIVGSYIAWQIRSFWRLPNLTVTSPVESVIDADHVVIAGEAESGAKVRLNEQPLVLQSDTHFEARVPLDFGLTIIRLEAEGASGRVNTVEKHLLRPRNVGTLK